jgi:hypothetical protein
LKIPKGILGSVKRRRTDNTMATRYQREVTRIRKEKKDRQHNTQKKKDKWTNNGLQNIHIKSKIE